MGLVTRQVQLSSQPQGQIRATDFDLVDSNLPEGRSNDIVVRNEWMSVDPYMRLGLGDQKGFLAPLQPGDVMQGAAIGVVEQSRDPAFPEGSHVLSNMGWRSRFLAQPEQLAPVSSDIPLHWHLGILGLTGVTAYLGIEEVLAPRAGETMFISGASGAVGSIAVQLAKLRGARVIGTCSSPEKAAWLLQEAGIDAVSDYRQETTEAFLDREAPDGVDCYFDNVGGPILECLLGRMKPYGRVALCGAMSQYEAGDYRRGPADFFSVIEKSLTLRGFNAFLLSHDENAKIVEWLKAKAIDRKIKPFETIIDGLDKAASAFAGLFQGGYLGKVIVKIHE